jgi:RNA polymerase sigma-70 factor (ECF subfamily)
MELLPDGYRIVFSLYFIEGYDHDEIAEITGISASTSRSQLARARKKLLELLIVNK